MLNKIIYLSLLPVLLLTSCATIMHGTRQTVGISSNPSNAYVYVDQYLVGSTPIMVDLTRKDNHYIRLELEGYQPYEMVLTRQLSVWVFGNVVFGGIVGLVVDWASGGIYRLTPEQINAEMSRNNMSYSNGQSYIGIVMQPDASWEKVGQLERVCQ